MLNSVIPLRIFFSGTRDPFQVLSTTAEELSSACHRARRERRHSFDGSRKWTVREILAHLANNELAFGFRLRQGLGDPHHIIQPYDQERWADHYSVYDAASALNTFTVTRDWNMKLVRALTPEELAKPITHPERGAMTMKILIETIAGHDRNHLLQIQSIAEQAKAAGA